MRTMRWSMRRHERANMHSYEVVMPATAKIPKQHVGHIVHLGVSSIASMLDPAGKAKQDSVMLYITVADLMTGH